MIGGMTGTVCRVREWFGSHDKPISIIAGILLSIMLVFSFIFLTNMDSLFEYLDDGGVLHTLRVMPYLQSDFLSLVIVPLTPFIYLTRRSFEKEQTPIIVASILISACIVASQSLIKTHTFSTLGANGFYAAFSVISFIAISCLIFLILRPVFYALRSHRSKKENEAERGELEQVARSDDRDGAPVRGSTLVIIFCVLLVAWLPYLIVFLPGSINYDMHCQLLEFAGVVGWSNHNPVVSTMLYGSIFSLGNFIGGCDIGLLFISVSQTIFMAAVLTVEAWVMMKLKAPRWMVYLTIAFFALYPLFPCYSINAVKDVLFTITFILYFSLFALFAFYPNELSKKKMVVLLLVAAILCGITRNNGLYVVALSLPFMLVFLPDARTRLRALIPICLCIVMIPAITFIAMLSVSAQAGSVREALSVPFMQSARAYLEHSDDMGEHELKVLDDTFVLDDLDTRYDPYLSDKVKDSFVEGSSLTDYAKVWADQAIRYPMSYLDAWGELTFGYWSLTNDPEYWPDTFYNHQQNGVKGGVETPFKFSFVASYPFRQSFSQFIEFALHIPFVNYLMQGGLYTWMMIILAAFLVFARKSRYFVIALPCVVLMLTSAFGPMNGLPRYFLGDICVLPLLVWSCIFAVRRYACAVDRTEEDPLARGSNAGSCLQEFDRAVR